MEPASKPTISLPRCPSCKSYDFLPDRLNQLLPEEDLMMGPMQNITVEAGELQIISLLGQCSEGGVYKGELATSSTNTAGSESVPVAVWWLNARGRAAEDSPTLDPITAEHPNVVRCLDRATAPPYIMVTEFCPGGSLDALLYGSSQQLSVFQRVKILRDVACGMRHLHKQSPAVYRGTLKSSNVLLTEPVTSVEQDVCAKVVDFGLWSSEQSQFTQEFDNSWRWQAPEIFEMDDDVPVYTESADVYSFAMVLYEVFACRKPYIDTFPEGEDDPRAGLSICLGTRPATFDLSCDTPIGLSQVMERCWAGEAALRPTFSDLEDQLDAMLVSLNSERSR
jgi:serine/threonine protein kinase